MTKIEWTEQTWNPIAGCSVVSPGCTNCYAMQMAARIEKMSPELTCYHGLTKPSRAGPVWTGKVSLASDKTLSKPLRRAKPTMYFVNSMSDLFHEDVPDAWIDRVFAVMALSPQHTFQVLTKRSARMRVHAERRIDDAVHDIGRAMKLDGDKWRGRWQLPLPNVWLGVSCEDQRRADERIPDLLATPAAVRFVSAEPLLGPIDFDAVKYTHAPGFFGSALRWHHQGHCHQQEGLVYPTLDWVIVGGESGFDARPMALGWAKDIVRQCQAAGVPVFVKQLGANPTNREGERCQHVTHGKGANMTEWPAELRVREMPDAA